MHFSKSLDIDQRVTYCPNTQGMKTFLCFISTFKFYLLHNALPVYSYQHSVYRIIIIHFFTFLFAFIGRHLTAISPMSVATFILVKNK